MCCKDFDGLDERGQQKCVFLLRQTMSLDAACRYDRQLAHPARRVPKRRNLVNISHNFVQKRKTYSPWFCRINRTRTIQKKDEPVDE